MFSDFFQSIKTETATKVVVVGVILIIGMVIAKIASKWVVRVIEDRVDAHRAMLARRLTYYALLAVTLVTALNEAGINLSVVVGAAGVASVAIGFASQTSMSNLISGIFMIIEKPFMVGDTIKIGATVGEVATMGLLSTMLKTPDNTLVRLPNETLMKSEITNVTRFSQRRFEILVQTKCSAHLDAIKDACMKAVTSSNLVLKDPKPQITVRSIMEESVYLTIHAWAQTVSLSEANFDATSKVKAALDQLS